MVHSIKQLHDKARRAIESGEESFAARAREAAKYLAAARKQGAKPQASAAALGRSRPWVLALLKWHDDDYPTKLPFTRAARKPACQPADSKRKSLHVETVDLLPNMFDEVVGKLTKLAKEPPATFARTAHAAELDGLADFLRDVAKEAGAAKVVPMKRAA